MKKLTAKEQYFSDDEIKSIADKKKTLIYKSFFDQDISLIQLFLNQTSIVTWVL